MKKLIELLATLTEEMFTEETWMGKTIKVGIPANETIMEISKLIEEISDDGGISIEDLEILKQHSCFAEGGYMDSFGWINGLLTTPMGCIRFSELT